MPTVSDWVHISRLDVKFGIDSHEIIQTLPGIDRSRGARKVLEQQIWKRGKELGRGGFATVFLESCAESSSVGGVRAVKELKKHNNNDYHRELEAAALFSHPKYEDSFVKSFGWYETNDNLYLTMEYLPHGDLDNFLGARMPEIEGQLITTQVMQGLSFMHEREFTHRDLKPANIMVSSPGPHWLVKIADFGISKRAEEGMTALRTQVFTPAFAAPEVFFMYVSKEHAGSYTNAVDIWSAGMLAFKILTGENAFEDAGHLFRYYTAEIGLPRQTLCDANVSAEGMSFVSKLLSRDPKLRPTARECLLQDWLMRETGESCDRNTLPRSIQSARLDPPIGECLNMALEPSGRWTTVDRDELKLEIGEESRGEKPADLSGHNEETTQELGQSQTQHDGRNTSGGPAIVDVMDFALTWNQRFGLADSERPQDNSKDETLQAIRRLPVVGEQMNSVEEAVYERLRNMPDSRDETGDRPATASSPNLSAHFPITPRVEKERFHSGYDGRRGSVTPTEELYQPARTLSPANSPPASPPFSNAAQRNDTTQKPAEPKHKSDTSSHFSEPKAPRWTKTSASSFTPNLATLHTPVVALGAGSPVPVPSSGSSTAIRTPTEIMRARNVRETYRQEEQKAGEYRRMQERRRRAERRGASTEDLAPRISQTSSGDTSDTRQHEGTSGLRAPSSEALDDSIARTPLTMLDTDKRQLFVQNYNRGNGRENESTDQELDRGLLNHSDDSLVEPINQDTVQSPGSADYWRSIPSQTMPSQGLWTAPKTQARNVSGESVEGLSHWKIDSVRNTAPRPTSYKSYGPNMHTEMSNTYDTGHDDTAQKLDQGQPEQYSTILSETAYPNAIQKYSTFFENPLLTRTSKPSASSMEGAAMVTLISGDHNLSGPNTNARKGKETVSRVSNELGQGRSPPCRSTEYHPSKVTQSQPPIYKETSDATEGKPGRETVEIEPLRVVNSRRPSRKTEARTEVPLDMVPPPPPMSSDSSSSKKTRSAPTRFPDETSCEIPEDGSPITLPINKFSSTKDATFGGALQPDKGRTSLLFEYFENSKAGGTSKPFVRVKVAPDPKASSSGPNDAAQIVTAGEGRALPFERRVLPESSKTATIGPENTMNGIAAHVTGEAAPVQEVDSERPTRDRVTTRKVTGPRSRSKPSSSAEQLGLLHDSTISAYWQGPRLIRNMKGRYTLQGSVDEVTPRETSGENKSTEPEKAPYPVPRRNSLDDIYLSAPATERHYTTDDERLRSTSKERIARRVVRKLNQDPSLPSKSSKSRSRRRDYDNEGYSTKPRRRSPKAMKYDAPDQKSDLPGTHMSNNANLLPVVEDTIRRIILPELQALKEKDRNFRSPRPAEDSRKASILDVGQKRRVNKPAVVLNREGGSQNQTKVRRHAEQDRRDRTVAEEEFEVAGRRDRHRMREKSPAKDTGMHDILRERPSQPVSRGSPYETENTTQVPCPKAVPAYYDLFGGVKKSTDEKKPAVRLQRMENARASSSTIGPGDSVSVKNSRESWCSEYFDGGTEAAYATSTKNWLRLMTRVKEMFGKRREVRRDDDYSLSEYEGSLYQSDVDARDQHTSLKDIYRDVESKFVRALVGAKPTQYSS